MCYLLLVVGVWQFYIYNVKYSMAHDHMIRDIPGDTSFRPLESNVFGENFQNPQRDKRQNEKVTDPI